MVSTEFLFTVQDGVCQRTIDRPAYVESITWFPGGEGDCSSHWPLSLHKPFFPLAFLSVEGSDVAKLVRQDNYYGFCRAKSLNGDSGLERQGMHLSKYLFDGVPLTSPFRF